MNGGDRVELVNPGLLTMMYCEKRRYTDEPNNRQDKDASKRGT
jgi:hypothetical protein